MLIPDLLNLFKKKNIHLEFCITSSIKTKSIKDINKHPIKFFHENNFNFSINTDDPSIFNINYKKEIEIAKNILKLNDKQLYKIMLNSLESSFASDKEKRKIEKYLNKNNGV